MNYYVGTVVATCSEESDKLEKSRESREILVDIPGVIQGVKAYPYRGELDEPRIGDRVIIEDFDPLYHSYLLYRKLKENDVIGFRSSGKLVDIKPDEIVIGVYSKDAEFTDSEVPESLDASITLKDGGDIVIKSSGKIEIDGYGESGKCIVINGGTNGGMVNIDFLKQVLTAINSDLLIAGSGSNLGSLLGLLDKLEDKNLKH